jgi:hypothetical protein
MNNSEQNPQSCQTDVSGSAWFETEQIETFVGEMDNGGERKKLVVLHQCGEDKKALIEQLKTMISGLETNFDWFAS